MHEPPFTPSVRSAASVRERIRRGQLRVFLGAAPGIGKTSIMLSKAAMLRAQVVDVVIGSIAGPLATEVDRLARDLEIVADRMTGSAPGGTGWALDAVLARRPALVLVDNLACGNAPGSRHPKRYQDVDELLAAGISVFATLNIHGVESLSDTAAAIAPLTDRETVPDGFLETAEIELVDFLPGEISARRHDQELAPFYLSGDEPHPLMAGARLMGLRALALRWMAQRADAQVARLPPTEPIDLQDRPGERIVVAVDTRPGADALVRSTKRIADASRASWTAVFVETPRSRTLAVPARQRLAATLSLAGQLGASVRSVPGRSVLQGLQSFAADQGATQIVVGQSRPSGWFELRHRSIVDRLTRELPGVAVHVLPTCKPSEASEFRGEHRRLRSPRGAYLWTALMVGVVTALGSGLLRVLNINNVALLYLVPVMMAASLFGLRAGLFAGIASSFAYNFFFLPPTGTLTISNPENVVTVAVLLGVALVTSQFAARVRSQADLAAESARANAALAEFLRRVTASSSDGQIGQAICEEVARLFGVQTVLMLPGTDGVRIQASVPPRDQVDMIDRAAAQWVLERGQPAGRGSDTLTASDWLFHPIHSGDRIHATLGVARADGAEPIAFDRLPLLLSLLDQAALGLERARLQGEMRDVAELKERDRLRAALLSSVSHDLRTPLTTIMAASEALSHDVSPSLIASIRTEAERLNRFVANLLDMARVEAGAIRLHREPVDLTDAVAAALHDTRRTLDGHEVRLKMARDVPLVTADPQLLHHCLINLLDNAGRYAEPGTSIEIVTAFQSGNLMLSVEDEGPGLPIGQEAAVFETFRRFAGSDQAKAGTGLGLAIVKGFAEAMGLRVTAANRGTRSGAAFTLVFPAALLLRERDEG